MTSKNSLLPEKYAASKNRKKAVSEKLSTAIIYIALVIIAILAIPVCICIGAIVIVWTLADKIVRKLESE